MFGRRILILIPHPDDEVAGCSAAIGRARAAGARVFGAYLTTGVPPRERLWPWQRAGYTQRIARRREEAGRAAALLGLEPVHFGRLASRTLRLHLAAERERILDLVAQHEIDTLWAPAYEGGHQDHDAANCLASTLRARGAVWEFSEYNFAGGRVQCNRFPAANGTEQTLALSITEQERKREGLRIYASERGNLRHIRVEREVFRPLVGYDYAQPPHPGRLFYQRFAWAAFHPRVDGTAPREVCRALAEFAQQYRL